MTHAPWMSSRVDETCASVRQVGEAGIAIGLSTTPLVLTDLVAAWSERADACEQLRPPLDICAGPSALAEQARHAGPPDTRPDDLERRLRHRVNDAIVTRWSTGVIAEIATAWRPCLVAVSGVLVACQRPSSPQTWDLGCHAAASVGWMCLWEPYIRADIGDDDRRLIIALTAVVRRSFWAYAYRDVTLVCDRPIQYHIEQRRDGQRRLDCATGPAVTWADRTTRYVLHGLPVPEHAVMDPARITDQDIDTAPERTAALLRARRAHARRKNR